MLCSSGSIFHIVFDEVHFGMPDCMSFAVLSVAELVETISDKCCRDVFHGYFLPLYILQCSKPDKNIRNMACWEAAAGYWRDSGVFFYFWRGMAAG
jgi:hypothetical protein